MLGWECVNNLSKFILLRLQIISNTFYYFIYLFGRNRKRRKLNYQKYNKHSTDIYDLNAFHRCQILAPNSKSEWATYISSTDQQKFFVGQLSSIVDTAIASSPFASKDPLAKNVSFYVDENLGE